MPPVPDSRRHQRLARLREARAARAERRQAILDLVVSGFDRAEIARRFGVSLRTAQREVDRALDGRRFEAPDRYLRLQIQRLEKALRTVDLAIEEGDVNAVSTLIALLGQLDRYHGLAAREAAATAAAQAPPALADARTPKPT